MIIVLLAERVAQVTSLQGLRFTYQVNPRYDFHVFLGEGKCEYPSELAGRLNTHAADSPLDSWDKAYYVDAILEHRPHRYSYGQNNGNHYSTAREFLALSQHPQLIVAEENIHSLEALNGNESTGALCITLPSKLITVLWTGARRQDPVNDLFLVIMARRCTECHEENKNCTHLPPR